MRCCDNHVSVKYIENTITPKRGWFHPVDQHVEREPAIERKSIQQINLLEDETVVMLYELAGDHGHISRTVEQHFDALAYSTSEIGSNTLVWTHVTPSTLVKRLLRITQEYNIVLQMPLEFTREGGVKCVFVGDETALQAATQAIPDEVRVDVRRMGDYSPGVERFSSVLTERQEEILDVAVELGYYDDPRNVTHEDIAAQVGCNRTTVGEHLRKIESKVMPAIKP